MSEEYTSTRFQEPRRKSKLPERRYTATVVVYDQPAPGEDYLTPDEIVQNLHRTNDLDAGVSIAVGVINIDLKRVCAGRHSEQYEIW